MAMSQNQLIPRIARGVGADAVEESRVNIPDGGVLIENISLSQDIQPTTIMIMTIILQDIGNRPAFLIFFGF